MAASGQERQRYALQTIFSFFVGLMVLAFIGVGVNTFYQSPDQRFSDREQKLFRQQQDVTGTKGDPSQLSPADRAKYKNLAREPWAALHVTREDFFAYVVLEGDVELSPVASSPDDATVEELVSYYRDIRGEHPDWDDYRAAQVKERRVMVRLRPNRAYGMA